jgi:hypothetical protein
MKTVIDVKLNKNLDSDDEEYSIQKNQSKLSISNKSGYKGVYFNKRDSNWRARIQLNKKEIHIGCYINIKDAARAYNEAALKYHGEFANLNKID